MKKLNLLLVCLMSGAALAIAQDNTPQSTTSDQGTMQQGGTRTDTDTGTRQRQQEAQPQQGATDYDKNRESSKQEARYAKRAKGVTMRNGRMMFVLPNGETEPVDRESRVSGMKVNPDGTVTMKDGNTTTLREGESVMKDGITGVMMRDGKVMTMSIGGQTRDLRSREITLMDGTKVYKDGRVTMKDGTTMTLSNGDMITADGTVQKGGQSGHQRQQPQQGYEQNQPGQTGTQTPGTH